MTPPEPICAIVFLAAFFMFERIAIIMRARDSHGLTRWGVPTGAHRIAMTCVSALMSPLHFRRVASLLPLRHAQEGAAFPCSVPSLQRSAS